MAEDTPEGQQPDPEELQEMLRRMFAGGNAPDFLREVPGGFTIDPEKLAGAAGLPNDPAALQRLMAQLQRAVTNPTDGLSAELAVDNATGLAAGESRSVTPAEDAAFRQALGVAELWLSEVTTFGALSEPAELLTRTEWIRGTMPTWITIAEPVAESIADALTSSFGDHAPEELKSMLTGAEGMIRSVGGALFAVQLGQVVGQLAAEVVSGGDIGIPLLDNGRAAVLPQNVADFSEGLDIPEDQVRIYLAVRELAHARLFRHARWLRLHLVSAITDFSRGISIDLERIQELAEDFDPANPEQLQQALADGSLMPEKTEDQLRALERLETLLAVIEGWVDVVTRMATTRLPKSDAIAETVRRRRATGGPAEQAFATLIGLELRPRRLREAAAMWESVTEAGGPDGRESVWEHPDLLPTAEEIDDPSALLRRVGLIAGTEPERDDIDAALDELLGNPDAPRPRENDEGGIEDESGPSTDTDDGTPPSV